MIRTEARALEIYSDSGLFLGLALVFSYRFALTTITVIMCGTVKVYMDF